MTTDCQAGHQLAQNKRIVHNLYTDTGFAMISKNKTLVALITHTIVFVVLYIVYRDVFRGPQILHIHVSNTTTTSRRWQPVGRSRDVYVVSAYYNQDTENVEIIALVERRKVEAKFECLFVAPSGIITAAPVRGSIHYVDSPPGYIRFHTVFIRCPTSNTYKPARLKLKFENHTSSLRVNYNPTGLYNFTVCIPTLYGPFSDHYGLIETVETDLLFGADHFTVYRLNVTPEVDRVLQHYVSKGIMDIVQWDTPVAVHHYGQWAHIQDCSLSSRYTSKYVVVKDVDEAIVPHKHRNWFDMLSEMEKERPNIGSYGFQNSFFSLTRKPDVLGFQSALDAQRLHIKRLLYVVREVGFNRIGIRSKSISRPERVIVTGIHYTMEFVKGYVTRDVDKDVAYLHHYKEKTFYGNFVKDDIMRTYAVGLIERVNRTQTELGIVGS